MTNTVNAPQELIECPQWIGGETRTGHGETFSIDSPYFGRPIGHGRSASPEDLQHAVQTAQQAQRAWAHTPLKERCQVMFRWREILLQRQDEISQRISLENGKTLAEAQAGLHKGLEVLEFALSLQNLDQGGRMEVSRGVFCEYRREPLGVVASITPFNFPAMVPMWTLPIALTLGNAYIWKPSEKTPLTAPLIAETLADAGLPAGLLSVVHGGQSTVEHLIDHEEIKAVAFVGSSPIARTVYQRGTQQGKRVLALGGAKNHIVLLPDAHPEISGRGISDSFTGCAGQRCMAASVLLAVGDVDHLIEKIVARAQSLQLGQDMGALISAQQVDFLKQAITRAEKAGAKVLLDGRQAPPPKDYPDGHWLGPTLLDQVASNSEAAQIELFGPVLSIVRCQTISEALEIENANPYGNACSVFTSSGPLAEKVVRQARAGMVGVNIGVPVPREPFSFAGINTSKFGHGEITGPASLDFWSDLKKVTTKWEPQADANWMS